MKKKKRNRKNERKNRVLFSMICLLFAGGSIMLADYLIGITEEEALVIAVSEIVIYCSIALVRVYLREKRKSRSIYAIEKNRTMAEPVLSEIEHPSSKPGCTNVAFCLHIRKASKYKKRIFLLSGICLGTVIMGSYMGSENDIPVISDSLSPSIPDSLSEFARKYPEAADFVSSYPKKKNQKYDIDLTSEVRQGHIPLFIQWDERWGYETYGSDCMGLTGCGPTCLSMVICGLTGTTDWNPYKVAQFSEQQGYYVWGEGTSWSLMSSGAQSMGLNVSWGSAAEDYIQMNLKETTPMIASVYPGDFTYEGHFIVLTDIDEAGNVTVNDPNSPANSQKKWPLDVLVPQIRSLWKYSRII